MFLSLINIESHYSHYDDENECVSTSSLFPYRHKNNKIKGETLLKSRAHSLSYKIVFIIKNKIKE